MLTGNGHSLHRTAPDYSDSVFCAIEYLVTRSQRQKIQVFLSFLFGVIVTKRERPDMFEENAVNAVEEE
jgi:hypothetical protein